VVLSVKPTVSSEESRKLRRISQDPFLQVKLLAADGYLKLLDNLLARKSEAVPTFTNP
jgi:hypothetical protein